MDYYLLFFTNALTNAAEMNQRFLKIYFKN